MQRLDRAGHDVPGRQLGVGVHVEHEPVAVAVDEPAPLAAHRLGDQKRAPADGQGGRVELDELHVAHGRAGAVGEGDAVAGRAGRVGGARVEGARAAGREQRHAGADEPQLVVAEHPGAGAAARRRTSARSRPCAPGRGCAGRRATRAISALGDGGAGGGAAGVQDAAAAVAALAAEQVGAVGVAIERARPAARGRRCGSMPSLDQHAHCGRVAETAADGEGVGGVLRRTSRRRRPRRPRRPGPCTSWTPAASPWSTSVTPRPSAAAARAA